MVKADLTQEPIQVEDSYIDKSIFTSCIKCIFKLFLYMQGCLESLTNLKYDNYGKKNWNLRSFENINLEI